MASHRWRSQAACGAKTRRSVAACRQCGTTALSRPALPASLVAPSGRSDVVGATSAGAILLSVKLRVGGTFQDRRQPGIRTQPAVLHLGGCSPSFAMPWRWHSPRCVVSRCATAWAESLEGAMSDHQSWALLCRYRCRLLLAGIPKGVDRNSELKHSAVRIGTNQRSVLQGLGSAEFSATTQNSKRCAATHRRTAGKRACALTARGSISKAMKGLVGGAQRTAAGNGPQPSFRGVRALELIPPVWSVPRWLELPGVEGHTNWRGAR